MIKRQVGRGTLLGAAVGMTVLLAGQPALAQSVVTLDPAVVPTTAAAAPQDCRENLGAGPYTNQDVWVFGLRGDPPSAGTFEAVTLTFDTPNGQVKLTITDDGGALSGPPARAWIRTDAGWTLTGGTGTVTGSATTFALLFACAAKPNPGPTFPPPKPSGSESEPGPTPTRTHCPRPRRDHHRHGASDPDGCGTLPVTGGGDVPVAGLAVTGGVLVLLGAGLMLLRNRALRRPVD